MAKILPLVLAPDPLLNEVSKPVEKVDDELRNFMDDMVKTMYANSGIGLAAVQVGQLKRVLVMDISYEIDENAHHDHSSCGGVHVKNADPLYLVNPQITNFSEEKSIYDEGCLSFPTAHSKVTRPKTVSVKYLDYNSNPQEKEMSEILATCVQHEIDHLNGITFVDHISRMKREVIIKKMLKLQKNNR